MTFGINFIPLEATLPLFSQCPTSRNYQQGTHTNFCGGNGRSGPFNTGPENIRFKPENLRRRVYSKSMHLFTEPWQCNISKHSLQNILNTGKVLNWEVIYGKLSSSCKQFPHL